MSVNISGTWDMVSNVNFDAYMVSLGIDFATRKVAGLLKTQKVIEQDGQYFTMTTVSALRNYKSSFKIGEEFEEVTKGLDNRKCLSQVNWIGDKLVCVQKGEKRDRGWTHWLEGDELNLWKIDSSKWVEPWFPTERFFLLGCETDPQIHLMADGEANR